MTHANSVRGLDRQGMRVERRAGRQHASSSGINNDGTGVVRNDDR